MKVRERHLPIGLEECVFVGRCVNCCSSLGESQIWGLLSVLFTRYIGIFIFFVVALIFSNIHGSTE